MTAGQISHYAYGILVCFGLGELFLENGRWYLIVNRLFNNKGVLV